ncbi:J domain-containing protein [Entamoeba marina]
MTDSTPPNFDDATDFYAILGLGHGASSEAIKKAYKKLALQYHPDKSSSPDAQTNFQLITNAYNFLICPKKKRVYDMYGYSVFKHPLFLRYAGTSLMIISCILSILLVICMFMFEVWIILFLIGLDADVDWYFSCVNIPLYLYCCVMIIPSFFSLCHACFTLKINQIINKLLSIMKRISLLLALILISLGMDDSVNINWGGILVPAFLYVVFDFLLSTKKTFEPKTMAMEINSEVIEQKYYLPCKLVTSSIVFKVIKTCLKLMFLIFLWQPQYYATINETEPDYIVATIVLIVHVFVNCLEISFGNLSFELVKIIFSICVFCFSTLQILLIGLNMGKRNNYSWTVAFIPLLLLILSINIFVFVFPCLSVKIKRDLKKLWRYLESELLPNMEGDE